MLLIENANIEDIQSEIILESDGKEKSYYVHGKFLQSESKNKNGRVYPKSILENQVTKYINESVSKGTAFGELDHPESRLELSSREISHRIVQLEWQGNAVFGKAKLLDTPTGNIAKALISDGEGRIGMSSRGSGTVKEALVQKDYRLITVDLVLNPSVADSVMTILREQQEMLIDNGVKEQTLGLLIEDLKNNKIKRKDFNRELVSRFKQLIKGI